MSFEIWVCGIEFIVFWSCCFGNGVLYNEGEGEQYVWYLCIVVVGLERIKRLKVVIRGGGL